MIESLTMVERYINMMNVRMKNKMTKLKTLKDLIPEAVKDTDSNITTSILKQEAIKWIKDCESEDLDVSDGRGVAFIGGCHSNQRCSAYARFMKFFNIVEEELK